MRIAAGNSRWTNTSKGHAVHIQDTPGINLCGKRYKNGNLWSDDLTDETIQQVTCQKCLSMYNNTGAAIEDTPSTPPRKENIMQEIIVLKSGSDVSLFTNTPESFQKAYARTGHDDTIINENDDYEEKTLESAWRVFNHDKRVHIINPVIPCITHTITLLPVLDIKKA